MATKLAINKVGQRKTDQCLQQDSPEDEVRGSLHGLPDIGIGKNALIVSQTHILDFQIQTIGSIVRE